MLYYRYRPSGELSLKELRYDEIYFSSTAESNDPYDGKVFLSYKFDKEKWKRLLETAWQGIDGKEALSILTFPLSEHLAEHSPSTYEETMRYDFRRILLDKVQRLDPLTAYQLDRLIKQFVDIYRPGGCYTVSFSKTNNNALMWSHYASKHKGFCLVFKALDGFLYQDKNRQLQSIERKTPNGLLAPSSGFGLPDRFMFCDINYSSDIEMIDASKYMPTYIFGRDLAEYERIKFVNENESKCLEKHDCWRYEDEARLILHEPTAWLFGDHFIPTQEERLLHYQPTQLVGIILGALMEPNMKDRIREMVHRRMGRISRNCKGSAVFDFVLFEAKISDKSRDLEITPQEIYSFADVLLKDDPKFSSRYKAWEEGWAIEFDKNSVGASRKQFP
jgi:hypothetical protein